uniref:Putative secreted protein n=1 Tax=Anopheles marajoara TaxID=58244 RepID=A0A2M4CEU1_9DIPT
MGSIRSVCFLPYRWVGAVFVLHRFIDFCLTSRAMALADSWTSAQEPSNTTWFHLTLSLVWLLRLISMV